MANWLALSVTLLHLNNYRSLLSNAHALSYSFFMHSQNTLQAPILCQLLRGFTLMEKKIFFFSSFSEIIEPA